MPRMKKWVRDMVTWGANDDTKWSVERILDRRWREDAGELEYLVQWTGGDGCELFLEYENTWEPARCERARALDERARLLSSCRARRSNLDCKVKVRQFEAAYEEPATKRQRKQIGSEQRRAAPVEECEEQEILAVYKGVELERDYLRHEGYARAPALRPL